MIFVASAEKQTKNCSDSIPCAPQPSLLRLTSEPKRHFANCYLCNGARWLLLEQTFSYFFRSQAVLIKLFSHQAAQLGMNYFWIRKTVISCTSWRDLCKDTLLRTEEEKKPSTQPEPCAPLLSYNHLQNFQLLSHWTRYHHVWAVVE